MRLRARPSATMLALVGMTACGSDAPEAVELTVLEEDDAVVIVENRLTNSVVSLDGRVIVREGPPSAPENCSTREVVARLQSFFDDVGAERDGIAAQHFVGPDEIEPLGGLSLAGGEDSETFAGHSIQEIDEFFVSRRGHGERITLEAVQINRWDLDQAHLGPLVITRAADDLPSGRHLIAGKAAFRCQDGKFIVLNLGAYQRTLK